MTLSIPTQAFQWKTLTSLAQFSSCNCGCKTLACTSCQPTTPNWLTALTVMLMVVRLPCACSSTLLVTSTSPFMLPQASLRSTTMVTLVATTSTLQTTIVVEPPTSTPSGTLPSMNTAVTPAFPWPTMTTRPSKLQPLI